MILSLRLHTFFLLTALLLSTTLLKGQTPIFQFYNLGEGKKTVRVQAVAQDEMHRIYFGTNEGLVRYDGTSYTPLSLSDSQPKHSITALHYAEGVLWAGGSKGELFRVDGNKVTPFSADSNLTSSRISDLITFGDALMIATYGDGLYCVRGKEVEHINVEDGLGDDYTYDFSLLNDRLWVGTDAGISVLEADHSIGGVVSMRDGLPDNIVKSIQPLVGDWMALGTHDMGVCRYNTVTNEFRIDFDAEHPWEHGAIESMVIDNEGVLWVGAKSGGLVRMDYGSDSLKLRAFSAINGLGSNRINKLFIDAEKSIWIGNSSGVTLYRGGDFEYLTASDGLPGSNIFDVLEDRSGNFWFATDEGVVRFSYGAAGQGLIETYMNDDELAAAQVVSLYEDNKGTIWMGTYGNGLFYLTKGAEKIRSIGKEDGLPNTNVLDITSDSQGRLWLATLGGGVVKFEWIYEGASVEQLDVYSEVGSNYIYTVFLDSKDQLWIGTDGAGVAVYDCVRGEFRPSLEGPLEGTTVYAITEDEEGAIWLATAESGLYRYVQGAFEKWGEEQGVRSDYIVALITGSYGEIYAIHPYGIDVLDKGMPMFKGHSSKLEGFNFEPNLNAAYYSNEHLWIGTESGAVKFQCDHSGLVQNTPKVTMTGLRVLYEPQSLEARHDFDFAENHFVFDYQGIWMKDPEGVEYKYTLEGFDKQWSFPTKGTVATYSSLPPGDYTFKVIASNGNGNWSEESESAYSFSILKPFWMQWWFYALLVLALTAGVTVFIRWRTKRLILDKQRLENEVEKRTVEIREQKDIIEAKSDEILSSINYARRIQEAILPPMRQVKEELPNSFVLYKPKDIVAGDFYWMNVSEDAENGKPTVLFAAADCTGHGVPGAMVSVVCSNALNRAAREYGLSKPASVLDKVLEIVIERFSKSEEEVKDGMDLALCSYQSSTRKLIYSGAQNPLWIVTKRELVSTEEGKEFTAPFEENGYKLYEIKPDKQPIGKYIDPKPFTNHTLHLEADDRVYIFSDGFADQFGGPRGKKLKYKPFKQWLLSIQGMPMDEQCQELDTRFEAWRGDLEQVDDVCVIGIKV